MRSMSIRHFAEPHHVGPHIARLGANRTDRLQRQIVVPDWVAPPASAAKRLVDLAMHVNEVLRSRHLMQRVDILRHDENLSRIFGLEASQRIVCGVGLHIARSVFGARCKNSGPARDFGGSLPALRPRDNRGAPRSRPCRGTYEDRIPRKVRPLSKQQCDCSESSAAHPPLELRGDGRITS